VLRVRFRVVFTEVYHDLAELNFSLTEIATVPALCEFRDACRVHDIAYIRVSCSSFRSLAEILTFCPSDLISALLDLCNWSKQLTSDACVCR
jgi:hypothetical protein